MDKNHFFKLLVFAFVVLVSCNKDDEIVIDEPVDGPENTPSMEAYFSVIEYLPAPGQFINERASGYDGVSTMEEACAYAEKRMAGFNYVSLGAFGGYIIVKAKKAVQNTGLYEFAIAGNSFDTSNEPGIVWVMRDTNGNGMADDTWYELKGSYYGQEGFEKNYWVTYFRPESGKTDVRWEDSRGDTGTVRWMGSFHSQDFYYPLWVKEDSYTLKGSRLPSRAYQDEAGSWINPPFEWGYADNFGELAEIVVISGKTVQKNYFRISDAVDADGSPVNLEAIDFIKVQTAVNGQSGIIGENSTEVCGFFITDP